MFVSDKNQTLKYCVLLKYKSYVHDTLKKTLLLLSKNVSKQN